MESHPVSMSPTSLTLSSRIAGHTSTSHYSLRRAACKTGCPNSFASDSCRRWYLHASTPLLVNSATHRLASRTFPRRTSNRRSIAGPLASFQQSSLNESHFGSLSTSVSLGLDIVLGTCRVQQNS